jgi:hypothetical protein
MKKPIVIACVAALVGGLGTAYTASACGGSSGSSQTHHDSKHALHGKIVSVGANSMVIEAGGKEKKGKQVTVSFANNVHVVLNGKTSSATQLAAGDLVEIEGRAAEATEILAKTPGEKLAHSAKKGNGNA